MVARLCGLVVVVLVGCTPGEGDPSDDTGGDTGEDTGEDTGADTDSGTPDACAVAMQECGATTPAGNGSQVWTARVDGTCAESPTQAMTGPFSHVSWSPDETRVRLVDGAGATFHVLRGGGDSTAAPEGSISPDWNWVASTSTDDDDNFVVSIAPIAGGDVRSVTFGANDYDQGFHWSPRSDGLAVNVENLTAQIDGPVLLDLEAAIVRDYTGYFDEGFVAWSPDGTRLANPAVRFLDGGDGTWILPADGSEPALASTARGIWLDADRLVAEIRTPSPDLVVFRADGTSSGSIWTHSDAYLSLRAASPTTLAVSVGADSASATLAFLDADGTDRRDVANSPTGWSGAFSPDGQWFAGTARDPLTATNQVYVVRTDGTGLRRITSATDPFSAFLAWSPCSDRILWTGAPPTP